LYYDDIEEREDAGTPPILQKIRASLAFWVKEYIGYDKMSLREQDYSEMAMKRLISNPNIRVLGNTDVERLPIFSFLIYPPVTNNPLHEAAAADEPGFKRLPLHGRFVRRLLNDLFGIQARGGCACTGPYGHTLLNIKNDLSFCIRSAILEVCMIKLWDDYSIYPLLSNKICTDNVTVVYLHFFQGYSGLKPGWTRLSFAYYLSKEEFNFILAAIEFIALYGHRFIPLYKFDWITGDWTFRKQAIKYHIMKEELAFATGLHLLAENGQPKVSDKLTKKPGVSHDKFKSYFEHAEKIALSLPDISQQTVNILRGVDPNLVLFHI
jgi:hypothetical protein